MTRSFDSFGKFAEHLLTLRITEALELQEGLKKAAEIVEKNAKAEIGFYQQGAGPFPQWEQLADSTEAEKARLGFEPDAPLLRTGGLRDSIDHRIEGLDALVGSTSDVMVYQELGTPTIPPRPVLGPAAIHSEEKIRKIIGAAALRGILSGEAMPAGLGYGFEVGE